MKNHELKTDPEVFSAIWDGKKTYAIRFDDRGFKVGDTLTMAETKYSGEEMRKGAPLEYTGRNTWREISHIQTGYGLGEGWCILSFKLPFPEALSPPPVAGLDDSDRERLLYVARVLRSAANLGRGIPLGGLWSEVLGSFGAVKRVLDMSDDDVEALNDEQLKKAPDEISEAFAAHFRSTCINSQSLRDAASSWSDASGKFVDSPEWDGVVSAIVRSLNHSDLHPAVFAAEFTRNEAGNSPSSKGISS